MPREEEHMKKTFLTIMLMILSVDIDAQNPVLLKPWIEVFGDTNGQSLGSQVTGFIPTPNFPYKAGITQVGKTGLYKLQNKSDKNPYGFVLGDNIKLADLNGDGFVDMVFRKPGDLVNIIDTVIIYWGTAQGIDSSNATKLTGEARSDKFGEAMCIGNIIGDSLPDLIITAHDYNNLQGKIYIYKGSSTFSTFPFITFLGDSMRFTLGWNCAIGDLNNDGFNDLILKGVFQYGTDAQRFDDIDIFFGSASFDTIRDIRITGKNNSQKGLACFDVNGDGIDDLLWTSTDSLFWVYVHYGGNNFSTTPSLRLKDPGIGVYGVLIANAGDMNGDGYNDIVVGTREGQVTSYVYIYGGGPKVNGELDAYYEISQSQFGSTVASVGDVNGDGLSDIIVGAPGYPFEQNKGYWGIFLGSTNIKVTSVGTGQPQQPQFFELYQNYPNPFNSSTVISYQLEKEAGVNIKVTNTLGQEIMLFNEGVQSAGKHRVNFTAKNLSSGWYVYTISVTLQNNSPIYTQSRAMILEK
jgi:hypothetical protein